MSASSMANVAYHRRADVPARGTARGSARTVTANTNEEPEAQSPATTFVNALATYIPTEVVTLYVAAINAFPAEPAEPANAVAEASARVPDTL